MDISRTFVDVLFKKMNILDFEDIIDDKILGIITDI